MGPVVLSHGALPGAAVAFEVAQGLEVSQQGVVDEVERPIEPPEAGERRTEGPEGGVVLHDQRGPVWLRAVAHGSELVEDWERGAAQRGQVGVVLNLYALPDPREPGECVFQGGEPRIVGEFQVPSNAGGDRVGAVVYIDGTAGLLKHSTPLQPPLQPGRERASSRAWTCCRSTATSSTTSTPLKKTAEVEVEVELTLRRCNPQV